MTKKIAINQPRSSYFIGGAEMVSIEHAKAALRAGYTVDFITTNPNSIHKNYTKNFLSLMNSKDEKLTVILIDQSSRFEKIANIMPGENKSRWFIESVLYAQSLLLHLEDSHERYDAIVSYFTFDGIFIPDIYTSNNVLYLLGNPNNNDDAGFRITQLAMYNEVVAISEPVRTFWQPYLTNKIALVPTAVDTKRFRVSNRLSTKANSQPVEIIFVGRLIENKGVEVLLEAISRIYKHVNVNVTIIGDGPRRADLEKIVKDKHLTNIVRFLGETPNPEDFLAVSDIAVFPSLCSEGLMGVVLEAMSAGLSVIATSNNGNEDLLARGRGVLVEPGNVSQLGAALMLLIQKSAVRHRMGRKAHSYIVENYQWDEVFARFIEEAKI